MEPNENQLNSYFHHLHHHHHQQHQHHHQSPTTSPTNGLLPATHHMSSTTATATATVDGGPHIVYPHSAPSAAAPLEPARRKRGRPRKYGTPEEALAAKKAATASSHSSSSKAKKEHRASSLNAASPSSPSFSASTKKSQFLSLGDPGHGFAPHVINVAAGEDVGQKIMLFLQQCKREICILSASGSISNASLRQPATSGGNITYEGRFEIVSLSGSYVNGTGGKTGGLSVCLSSADGHIVGGGVGGPLKAAGPVQVIIGTFVVDSKKEVGGGGVKGDASAGKLPSPVGGTSISGLRYGSTVDSSGGNHMRGNDDHQGIGESHFLLQSRGVNLTSPRPTDWRTCLDTTNAPAYDFSGRTGHHQSPENGDYDQIPD